MRRHALLVGLILTASACAGPTSVTDNESSVVATAAPVSTHSASTTLPSLDMEIQDCSSPPVTFSTLCEVYDLLETWYVDIPIDPGALAEVATRGLDQYTTTESEEPPRTIFCAIPHEAFAGLCDELAARIAEAQIPVGPAIEAAVTYMIDASLGPFTYYLPPGQTGSIRLNGIVGGIGVVLDARDAVGSKCTQISDICRLEIVVVLEDNPGFEAGLMAGDVISAVDGEPVAGKGFTAVVSLIAGNETGPVELTIERAGTETSVTIERAELVIPTVEAALPFNDVGYVRIPDFEIDVPSLVADTLAELDELGPDTLVVDLRDNPGGLVDAVVEVADDFIDGGVVMVSDATDEHLEYEATPGGIASEERLIVLVNKGTASAAEILAGALRDRRDAVIVGTNTFGKDAVQIPFTLRNGGEFYVVVARWSTPDGDTAGNGGLAPDREVEWPSEVSVAELVRIALEAAS